MMLAGERGSLKFCDMQKMSQYLLSLFRLFYPRNCAQCGWDLYQHEDGLCMRCLNALPHSLAMRNHPQMRKIFFGRCSWEEQWIFLKMEKSGPVRDVLHSLKYRHCPQVGIALGKWWAIRIERQYGRPKWDAIITVPLTNEKKRKRGYNQCDCIAEPMSERWKIPLEKEILIKRKGNKSQTLKSRIMRNSSVENPFEVLDPQRWEGKHILLLDDVVTTGATLEQCYQALSQIKNVRLSMAALAIPVHNRLVI